MFLPHLAEGQLGPESGVEMLWLTGIEGALPTLGPNHQELNKT